MEEVSTAQVTKVVSETAPNLICIKYAYTIYTCKGYSIVKMYKVHSHCYILNCSASGHEYMLGTNNTCFAQAKAVHEERRRFTHYAGTSSLSEFESEIASLFCNFTIFVSNSSH